MTEIQTYQPPQPAVMSAADQYKFAEIVTQGDLVPTAYRGKPANALIAINLGQAMGLNPAEALYRIDVIQGKPTASAELIAANVRKAGHKLRIDSDGRSKATVTIIRADDPDAPITVTRDMAWAKNMGLTGKENYRKMPGTMLEWRAITACARLACSEALYGVTYTPDELTDLRAEPARQQRNVQPASPGLEGKLADVESPAEAVEYIDDEQWAAIRDHLEAQGYADEAAKGGWVQGKIKRDIGGWQQITRDEANGLLHLLATGEEPVS